MALTKGLTWEELETLGFTVVKDKKTGKKRIDFDAPPAGKAFVPLRTDEEDINARGLDRRFVTRHKFSATTKTVLMEIIEEEGADAADAYVSDLKAVYKEKERKNRCKIRSPKTGKEIYCPESISCYSDDCPMKKGMKVTKDTLESLEGMAETVKSSVHTIDPTADAAITNVMWDAFKKTLRKDASVLADIIEWDEYGYKRDEILQKLKRKVEDTSWYYYQWKRIRNRWVEYNKD